jgi:hypothetical protein
MLGFGDKDKMKAGGNGHSAEETPSKAVNNSVTDNDAGPVCPPHTTEGKLLWKIDYHVVPFLCIMYLLAFLGKCDSQRSGIECRGD